MMLRLAAILIVVLGCVQVSSADENVDKCRSSATVPIKWLSPDFVAACDYALESEPDNPEILYLKARVSIDTGDGSHAIVLLDKAARLGNPDALALAGEAYLNGMARLEVNLEQASSYLERGVAKGQASSMRVLALALMAGKALQKDVSRGVALLEAAAKAGDSDAQYHWGMLLLSGDAGVTVDQPAGQEFIAKAYDAHQVDAVFLYGKSMVSQDRPELGIATLEWAGRLGHPDAYFVAGLYREMGNRMEQNYAEAMRLYKLGADQFSKDALFRLGRMYELGLGTDVRYFKAAEYYKQGRRAGSPEATYALGLMYLEGRGVEKDVASAIQLIGMTERFFPQAKKFMDAIRSEEAKARDETTQALLKGAWDLLTYMGEVQRSQAPYKANQPSWMDKGVDLCESGMSAAAWGGDQTLMNLAC